jgi:hypothetical protein
MAKMTFGEGIQLEVPLKGVISPSKGVSAPLKEVVEIIKESSVDLSPLKREIDVIKSKLKKNEHSINELQHKETIVKEVTIYKNDSSEIEALVAEVKVIEHLCSLNQKDNKEAMIHIKATQHILNSQVAKQSILNIVLGMGLLISTLIKFI